MDSTLLLLEDHNVVPRLIKELEKRNISVVKFNSTVLSQSDVDPVVTVFARDHNYIVLTSDNSFEYVTPNDLKDPEVTKVTDDLVEVRKNYAFGDLKINKVQTKKYLVAGGKRGHGGVRYLQQDLSTQDAPEKIAEEIKKYLSGRSNPYNNVEVISI